MCNVFKPDRCHHCSACNRCVLNMDHHCPWVNNCIGFWNRKFFVLLLFYSLCTMLWYMGTMLGNFVDCVRWTIDNIEFIVDWGHFLKAVLLECAYCFAVSLCLIMGKFAYFHFVLIRHNMTTIESLEHKGTNYTSMVSIC
jgi:hypothetical protein